MKFNRKLPIPPDYPKPPEVPKFLELSFFEKLRNSFIREYQLFALIIQFYKEIKMSKNINKSTNKYTWIAGALAVLNTVLGFFGLELDAETLTLVQSGIISFILAIIAVIAYYTGKKDSENE